MNQYYSANSNANDERLFFKHKIISKNIQRIVSGGYDSITYNGYPTGLIKIDSETVTTCHEDIKLDGASARLRYVYRTLQAPFVNETPNALLHLNSYKKIESFSDYSDLEVETLINYGFPAIYCSCIGENQTLSDCSEDIVLDRLQMGSVYNRGIRFNITDSDPQFFIDRKAATLFRTQHLKSILDKECFIALRPSDALISELANDMVDLLEKLRKTSQPTLFLERIIDFNRRHPFSTVSSAMFELTHYWLNQITNSVVISNRIMQEIDPGLKKHWTMRGYNPGSSAHVADILDSKDMDFIDFAQYIQVNFLEEFTQYYGDNEQNLRDIALDNIFYGHINKLETVAALDPSYESINEPPQIPPDLHDIVYYDEYQKKIIFQKAINHPNSVASIKRLGGAEFINKHLYKLAYIHVKESIGAEILRIIKLNKLGFVATTFQPDNRGEYFLLASVSDDKIDTRRIHVGIENEKVNFTELEPIDVSFAIKTYADFDPTLNYFLPENNILSLKTTRAKRFMQTYKTKESYLSDIYNIYYASKVQAKRTQIVVALPFFKEREVLIANINEFIATHRDKGDLHILLISNLPQQEFDVLLSRIDIRIKSRHSTLDHVFLYPVNTAEINAINLWMSNKILCFMLGLYFANYLIRKGLHVERFYLMESDIFNSNEWWQQFAAEQIGTNDLLLLDFLVYARDERSGDVPIVDIKENIFYELFEKPLMQIFQGSPTGTITGSSYCLGIEAIKKMQYLMQKPNAVQSIEWHLLNALGLLNMRTLNVGQKVHYTSSVIDDRFGHRILGLFEGLLENYEHLLLANANTSLANYMINEELSNVLATDYYDKAKGQAIKVASYFEGVYADILGRHEYKGILQQLQQGELDFERWLDILMLYFKACQGRSQSVIVELLNSLQPLSVMAFGSLIGKGVSLPKDTTDKKLKRFGIVNDRLEEEMQHVIRVQASNDVKQIIVSDIHGEYDLFRDLLLKLGLFDEGIIRVPKDGNLIVAGDILDCYSKPSDKEVSQLAAELVADSSVHLENLQISLQTLLKQPHFTLTKEHIHSLPQYLQQEVINAYKCYKLLHMVWQSCIRSNRDTRQGKVTFILGNHEIDLLNGKLLYRSIQKSLLLNMLGLDGVCDITYGDYKEGKQPNILTGTLSKLRDNSETYTRSIAVLNWLATTPTGALLGHMLIMHSGPTVELMKAIESGKLRNKYDLDSAFRDARKTLLHTDAMYHTPNIFDFRTDASMFIENPHRIKPFLQMYGCKLLAIGHSPYLNFQALGVSTDKETIAKHQSMLASVGIVNELVIKIDSGVKLANDSISALVLLDGQMTSFSTKEGVERIYNITTGEEVSKEAINKALTINKLIERI